MGVPALFRWLTKKYPKIITPVIEEQPYEIDGVQYPVDTTKPNPNGEELHNLYLDFNGIVHPCSHPDDKPPPANESEMMMEIFKYTDRVVNMVRPRRLLMIAIGMSSLLSSRGAWLSGDCEEVLLTRDRWSCSTCKNESTTRPTF